MEPISIKTSEHNYRGEMLTLGREARGLTQGELAEKLGVTQGKISKLEDGLLNLSHDDVVNLSKVLQYPEEFFAYSGPIEAASPSLYRKRSDIPAVLKRQSSARMSILRIRLQALLKAAQIEPNFPFCDPDEYIGGPTEIAQKLRAFWKVPMGPISNVTQVIENAGCIVIDVDFGTLKIDGCSEIVDGVPVIYINKDLTPARRRLTIVHELGHLVMHHFPTPQAEAQAFEFAAEFLMPREEVSSMFIPFSMDRLARLKLHWKVSMQALLVHAMRLGVVNERKYRYYWMLMGKMGYRQNEPYEANIPRENPSLWQGLIEFHASQLGYSTQDLTKTMLITKAELEVDRSSKGLLRIVR